MAGIDDVVTKLQVGNQNMQQLINVVSAWMPRAFGTFTMSATASKSVTDANCSSASVVLPVPSNATAGTLWGAGMYVTPANGSFTIATAGGGSAAGNETFSYIIFSPL